MSEPKTRPDEFNDDTLRVWADGKFTNDHGAELSRQLLAVKAERDDLKAEQEKYDVMRQSLCDHYNAEIDTLKQGQQELQEQIECALRERDCANLRTDALAERQVWLEKALIDIRRSVPLPVECQDAIACLIHETGAEWYDRNRAALSVTPQEER